jgi:bacterioferritin (cytochrome b1)
MKKLSTFDILDELYQMVELNKSKIGQDNEEVRLSKLNKIQEYIKNLRRRIKTSRTFKDKKQKAIAEFKKVLSF